jgi:hypothetical protein
MREEKADTETSKLHLALSRRKVRENCWKQLFEELVVMHRPRNPETEVDHPE